VNFFVNYFCSDERTSCLNLSVARWILCLYGVWKIASYPFYSVACFPEDFFSNNPYNYLSWFRWSSPEWVFAEQALAVLLLGFCALGLFRAFSTFGAALILTHLEGLSFAIENEKTSTNLAFFLIFYGIFRSADTITLDAFRANRRVQPDNLRALLVKEQKKEPIRLEALKWFLVTLAVIYFFTGFGKWQVAGWNLTWGAPENIRLAILNNAVGRTLPIAPLGEFLAGQPWLLAIAGYGTLFLELGFLIAVLLKLPVTPFFLGLAGMHTVIWLAMDVNYFTDMVFLYMAFVAWDSLAARLQRGRKLLVVYDEQCSFCMRTLLLLKSLRVAGDLRFVGASDPQAPTGHNYASAMVAFDANGQAFRGYDGFVQLFSFLGLTKPIAWCMSIPPVAAIGRRIYGFIARKRACSLDCRSSP